MKQFLTISAVLVTLAALPSSAIAQPPPNDDCPGATAINSLPYSTSQNTRLATPNVTDPVLTCADGGGGKTVWFMYTAGSTQWIKFSTLGSTPADYDIALALFSGTCSTLVEVRCNDDAGGTRQSEILYEVQGGTTYIIHIGEWNGGGPNGGVPTGGDLLFNVTVTTAPVLSKGPKNGSVPSGASVSTNSFPLAPAALDQEPKVVPLRPGDPPLLAPKNVMPPKGAEGSNYIEDRGQSSAGGVTGIPIVLQNFQGIPQTNFLPPDPAVAVGPNHVIACVNSTFRIWTKSGTILKTISLSSWWSNVRPGLAFSDPRIIYDHFANRWVMVGIDAAQSTTPILISVSDDDDPIGTWYNWSLPGQLLGDSATANFSDHPKLGFDDQALYITSREFAGPRQYSKLRIVGKAQLYANTGGPVAWKDLWDFRDPDNPTFAPDFLEPAMTYGSPGVEFLVFASQFSPGTFFTVWSLTNPLTSPSVTAVNVPVVAYGSPTTVPAQPGGVTNFGGGGNALWPIVVYRDSSLWAVHSVANPLNNANAALHYVRLNPFTYSNVEDVVMGLQGYWYIYPEIMPDADKNVVITYSRSSSSEYIGAYLSGRLSGDPPGLSSSVLLKAGQAYYNGSRWGDYMGIALDPSDSNAVWAFTQYAALGNSWGTWVGKVKVGPLPGAFISVSLASIGFGSVEVGDTSGATMITISNNGGLDTLVVSNISTPSSHFVLVNPPSLPLRLATFDSASFGIRFAPLAAGTFNDSLIISSNDTSNASVKISLSGTGFVVTSALRGVMYSTTGATAGSRLFTVDTSTAATTPVGAYGSGYTQIVSARVHPTSHEILGLVPSGAGHYIVRINSLAGDAHYVSTIPLTSIKGMAFRGDTLYVGRLTGGLYRVDIPTGAATLVATTSPIVNFAGMDFNPLTGQLWASVRAPSNPVDRIFKVAIPSGAATLVGQTGQGATPDIIFDGNGKLYGVIGTGTSTNSLIRIDTSNASSSVVGSMGIASVQALAMYPDSFIVGVHEVASTLPARFALDQNYPNPFNPTTQIKYALPVQSTVSLKIFNILGQEVATLFEGEQNPGFFVAAWDGTNNFSTPVTSGLYFYRLQASGSDGRIFREIKKMLLLK